MVGWMDGYQIIGYLRGSIYSHLRLQAASTIQCRRAEQTCFCRETSTKCGISRCSQTSCEVYSLHHAFGQPWGSFTGGRAHYISSGRHTYDWMPEPPQLGSLKMEEERHSSTVLLDCRALYPILANKLMSRLAHRLYTGMAQ